MKLRFLKNIKVDSCWENFLSDDILRILYEIESKIFENSIDINPSVDNALRFFSLNLRKVKILILGQDPYPQIGAATGRAFEVGTLNSWNQPFRNVSLKNILRTIYKAYFDEIITFNDLKKKINKDFKILPPNELFKSWEKQGVLLLNTSFSCEIGNPGSHEKLWNKFTMELLKYINIENNKIDWFIWGASAFKVVSSINIANKHINHHPMMCFDRENDFLYSNKNPFKETNQIINWTGV